MKAADASRIKVPPRLVMVFCRQLVTLLKSGSPLVKAMAVLQVQPESADLSLVLGLVLQRVESGRTLSDSLRIFPRVFPNVFVTMVRIGENSGTLDRCLDRLAGWLEADLAIRQRVKAALSYPAFICCLTFVLTIGLFSTVMPALFGVFGDSKDLPAITRLVMTITAMVRNPLCWVGAAVGLYGLKRFLSFYARRPGGAEVLYSLALQAPLAGPILFHSSCARYATAMATMLENGLPIFDAFHLAAAASDNPILVADAATMVMASTSGNSPAHHMLQHAQDYSKLTAQMVAIGEESSRLAEMFAWAAAFHRAEMETRVDNLSAVLEPILMGCVSVVVGVIMISAFLPLYGFLSKLS